MMHVAFGLGYLCPHIQRQTQDPVADIVLRLDLGTRTHLPPGAFWDQSTTRPVPQRGGHFEGLRA